MLLRENQRLRFLEHLTVVVEGELSAFEIFFQVIQVQKIDAFSFAEPSTRVISLSVVVPRDKSFILVNIAGVCVAVDREANTSL